MDSHINLLNGNVNDYLTPEHIHLPIDLTFLDPPFNQNKNYHQHDDNLPNAVYWDWMEDILGRLYQLTSMGGAVYFMQREKNTENVLRTLRTTGWVLQNLIIWKKLTSAVPSTMRLGKHYQVIAFATKGDRPRVFNKLRISPPLPAHYKHERPNGMYVTDVWDDIRELTSGYFAGDEALRHPNGERFHKQQAPLALLLRIILTSSSIGDHVFDPFSGTGTTLVSAWQLQRLATGIEVSPENIRCIQERLAHLRPSDKLDRFYEDYRYTQNLSNVWGTSTSINHAKAENDVLDLPLFRPSDT